MQKQLKNVQQIKKLIDVVNIDSTVIDLKAQETQCFIRGFSDCDYHKDILNKFKSELSNKDIDKKYLQISCPGGGRIERNNDQIKIYGYSVGYGQADHELTKKIICQELQILEKNIEVSNEGYQLIFIIQWNYQKRKYFNLIVIIKKIRSKNTIIKKKVLNQENSILMLIIILKIIKNINNIIINIIFLNQYSFQYKIASNKIIIYNLLKIKNE